MDYKDLIKNWHSKASEEDYFSKFIFEYLAFIAYLKTQKYYDCKSDREAIQKLKQDLDIRQKYLEHINNKQGLKNDWQHIEEELNRAHLGNASRDLFSVETAKWWNCSHDKLTQKTEEEKRKASGVIHSLQDWENMVEFWYIVRNNLFHGAKNPENEGDQFAVKYGYKTLKELMEILLNKNERK